MPIRDTMTIATGCPPRSIAGALAVLLVLLLALPAAAQDNAADAGTVTAEAFGPCECPPGCPDAACEAIKASCESAVNQGLDEAKALHRKPQSVFDLSCLNSISDTVRNIPDTIPNISFDGAEALQALLDRASEEVCRGAEELFAPIRDRFDNAETLVSSAVSTIEALNIPGLDIGRSGGDSIISIENLQPEVPAVVLPDGAAQGSDIILQQNDDTLRNILQ